jgi:hypothetical protein
MWKTERQNSKVVVNSGLTGSLKASIDGTF